MNIESLRDFLGWCTLINLGLLIFSTIMIVSCRSRVSRIHQKMFGLDEAAISHAYFRYLANYKIVVIVFNLVPYVALRIMA